MQEKQISTFSKTVLYTRQRHLKRICVVAFLVLAVLQSVAQTRQPILSVIVTDSLSGSGIPYATISVKDSGKIKTFITDAQGKISFHTLLPGINILTISSAGYQPVKRSFTVTDNWRKNDTVRLSRENNVLKQVTVSGQRPVITREADRLVYDVTADKDNKNLSLLDVMRKIPLITVQGLDQVRLKGSDNFLVLINGRESSLAKNFKEVVNSFPASAVQKIEVITTPPAKYSAEGLAGIINIVLLKRTANGYAGSLGGRMNFTYGPSLNGSLLAKAGKFDLSAVAGQTWRTSPQSTILQQTNSVNPESLQIENGFDKSYSSSPFINLDLSYQIDSLNLLALSFDANFNKSNDDRTFQTSVTSTGNSPISSYQLMTANNDESNSADFSANYQLGLRRHKNQFLTVSYLLRTFPDRANNTTKLSQGQNFSDQAYGQNNSSGNNENTVQADYTQPIGKNVFETGLKAIFRSNYSDYAYSDIMPGSNNFINTNLKADTFAYKQTIYSAYGSYRLKLKSWSSSIGVRLENTVVNASFENFTDHVSQNYVNLIPVFSIQYSFKNSTSLNMGYTQRISRPGITLLNPFVNELDPKYIYKGNPNLKAALANSFELDFSSYQKASTDISLDYSYKNNNIDNVNLFDQGTGVTTNTFINSGSNKSLSGNFSFVYPLTKKLNVNINSGLTYSWITGIVDGQLYHNNGLQGSAFAVAGYNLTDDWKIRLNIGYTSGYLYLQGETNSSVYSSFSLSKNILHKKGNISLLMANPFQHYWYFKDQYRTPDSFEFSRYQNYYRQLLINFRYNFGKLKGEMNKNRKGIDNDDLRNK